MITIYVESPQIEYDTVYYSWTVNKAIPFVKQDCFYIKYDGICLESLPNEYYWNAYLSLMIPVLNQCNEEVLFIFPECIPTDMAETWINYHGAEQITIFPLMNSTITNNYVDRDKTSSSERDIGIFYGGGKDSNYALSVLSEISGINNILLISYVFPLEQSSISKVDQRREKLMLEPLKKELNIQVQKVITDFRTTLKNQRVSNHIHNALYTGTVMPIVDHYHLSLLTYSYEFNLYWTGYYDRLGPHFNFKRSRPEFDQYIEKRSNKIFGTSFSLVNSNYYISELVGFKVVAERYPHMLKYLLMCESTDDPDVKWCQRCHKCAEYVLYSLCYGHEQSEIDINYFLTESPYVKSVLDESIKLPALDSENGNRAWSPSIVSEGHYQSFCHVIASIDTDYVQKRASQAALTNFVKLKERFGNKKHPYFESFISPAFQHVSPPLPEKIRTIVTDHCPGVDSLQDYFYFGRSKITFDYTVKSDIPQVFRLNHGNNYLNGIAQGLLRGMIELNNNQLDPKKGIIKSGNVLDDKRVVPLQVLSRTPDLEMYIDQTNPVQGDYMEWSQDISVIKGKGVNIKLCVQSPYQNVKMAGRMVYKVVLDEHQVLEEDVAMWGNKNEINIYCVPNQENMNLKVRLSVRKDCESWNWGYSGRLIIRQLAVNFCTYSAGLRVFDTSPYSLVGKDEG